MKLAIIDTLLARYKKLNKREQILTIAITAVVLATLYNRILYRPFAGSAATYRFQIQKLTTKLDELDATLPPIERQKKELDFLTRGNKKILNEIEDLEKRLPGKKDASRLTGELARMAKDIELVSMQQKIDEGELYSRIFVDLTVSAPYKDIVSYINDIETISPFLKIDEMDVSEPKGKTRGRGMSVRLLLSCLLGELPVSEWLSAERSEPAKEEPSAPVRDIFISKSRPVTAAQKTDFKLDGITYNPGSPTAIINDDVVKIGSEINGFTVTDITFDKVILTSGIEEFSLTIER